MVGLCHATVAHRGMTAKMADDDFARPPPVSACDHPARRLALCAFHASYRDIEDLLAERGLDVSYETVRRWVLKFGHRSPANFAVGARGQRRMASRRDGRDDRGPAVLALARGRRRRRGSRPAGAATARQGCSREADAQAAQETRLRTRGAGDRRQASVMRAVADEDGHYVFAVAL